MSDEPKRHRIELTCPDCGHRQKEPAMVFSSTCRACQTHFEVINGKALTREKNVKPFARVRKESAQERPVKEERQTGPSIRVRKSTDEPEGDEVIKQESTVTPFTRIRKETTDVEEPEEPRVRAYNPADRHSKAPSDARPFWLKLLKPNKPPRHTSCFECGAPFTALGDAQSSQCPKCGSYVSLQNFEIEDVYNRRIQTRGDVKILKRGTISGTTIKCHHLTVLGALAGSVECSGDLIIRSHGKIIGTVKCRNLRIQKGAKVEFLNPVNAETARIDGEVHGQIFCTGSVTLEKRAKLHGLVRTTSLVVKPGAKHSGMIEMVSNNEEQ